MVKRQLDKSPKHQFNPSKTTVGELKKALLTCGFTTDAAMSSIPVHHDTPAPTATEIAGAAAGEASAKGDATAHTEIPSPGAEKVAAEQIL